MNKKNVIRIIQFLLLFLAILFVLLIGSACTTPQVIREIQTAKTIEPGNFKTDFFGGISWAATGVASLGIPNVPNCDLSLLFRYSNGVSKELQFSINLSLQLTPSDEIWYGHVSGGFFIK